jgi:hypothetical protein
VAHDIYVEGRPVEIQIPKTVETDEPQRYRPAVFFRHLRPVVLSFGQGKIQRV